MKTGNPFLNDGPKLPQTYRELCSRLLPRTIHDDAELETVQEVVDVLAVLPSRNPEQQDYLETLTELIEAYEAHAVPMRKPTGIQTLKFLLTEHHLTASDLSRILGKDTSLGYRILNGERSLTVEHIKRLAERFGVGAEAFL